LAAPIIFFIITVTVFIFREIAEIGIVQDISFCIVIWGFYTIYICNLSASQKEMDILAADA